MKERILGMEIKWKEQKDKYERKWDEIENKQFKKSFGTFKTEMKFLREELEFMKLNNKAKEVKPFSKFRYKSLLKIVENNFRVADGIRRKGAGNITSETDMRITFNESSKLVYARI